MSPGKLVDEKDVGCQDKSGPAKIHEVILVNIRRRILVELSTSSSMTDALCFPGTALVPFAHSNIS